MSSDGAAICCDCERRADLPYFACESEDKKSFLCVKCYIRQMIQFAIKNGYEPIDMGSNPTIFYDSNGILDNFCPDIDYY